MISSETKIFKDNIHGYIKVPVDYVRLFIDTEIFQRLRFIEQTGMRVLYPSARHDRFIHSLGTYHLGCKAFDNFKLNVRTFSNRQVDECRKHYNVIDSDKNELFWDKCKILFQIACLMHDCGHAPFSHTLEFVYEYPVKETTSLKDKLKQCFSTDEFKCDFVNQGTQHERMSALVVCIEYGKRIQFLIEKYGLKLDEDEDDDVEFIARMIIGCQYGRDNKINRIKNCFISLLNSNSIDVDSLDYIIRDSKLSGIDNMSVDVDRLLSSLTLIEKTIFSNKHIRNASINTNVLNGKLLQCDGSKASIKGQYIGKSRIYNYEGELSGSIALQGTAKIKKNTIFKKANNNILKIGAAKYIDTIHENENLVDIELFGITDDKVVIEGSNIELKKENNGSMYFKADKFEIDSAFIKGNIDGIFSGELLGYYCDLGGKLSCELGFHKSSLSVIQNVLIARNYEYQWIYSHHKVVYYSNYLIIELLIICIKFLLEYDKDDTRRHDNILTNILSWERMIKNENKRYSPFEFSGLNFLLPTDGDIVSLFKRCKILCIENNDNKSQCSKLLNEYFSRNYRKSLWKSLAEYRIFFSDLSDNEKTKLYNLILKEARDSVIDQYGYFNDEWEKAFKGFGLKNAVWVNADSKLKVLNPDNTCILFKDITLNYRTVALSNDVPEEKKLNLFYIYYEEENEECGIDSISLKSFIKNKLKEFL